jgi:hypothetical protein
VVDASSRVDNVNAELGLPVKKAFFYSLIVSVILSACIGVLTILQGHYGWVEVRILLTTVTVVGASICGLACGAYLASRHGQVLPLLGIGLTFLAAGMVILGIWTELPSAGYWQIAAVSGVLSVACAHLSLLSMARLTEGYQWSLTAAYIAIFGVAALIIALIVSPRSMSGIAGAGVFQLLGVATIIDAAITILIPIFHRLSKDESAPAPGASFKKSTGHIDAEVAALRARIDELERMRQQIVESERGLL